MVADRAIKVDLDQNRLNRVRVLQECCGIGRCAQPCHVDGATQKALNDAIIVGRGEKLGFDAERFGRVIRQTLVAVHPVLSVFTAEDTDAEFGDFLGKSASAEGCGGGKRQCEGLFHCYLRGLLPYRFAAI